MRPTSYEQKENRVSLETLQRLEPDEGKLSRPVPRRAATGNSGGLSSNKNNSTSFLSIKDALAILNIQSNNITAEDIKTAYRKAAAKYHPDHNPAGLEMMKMINVAYETLKAQGPGKINTSSPNTYNYGEAINNALNAVINLGLNIEVCGVWVWVSGDTKPHKDTLKSAGFFWSPKKTSWYFRPENHKSKNRKGWTMDKIREVYGVTEINPQNGAYKQLCAYA